MSALEDLTVDGARHAALEARIEQLEAQLAEHRSPRVEILSEPLTYEARLLPAKGFPGGFRAIPTRENHSYVRDFVLAQCRTGNWRPAMDRQERHAEEMRKVGQARERLFYPDVEVEFEQRATSWTNGQGGYFAPPLWIVEQFATVPTPARVLAEKAPKFELPVGAQSVSLPGWTAGAEVGVTTLNNVPPTVDIIDQPISSAVATIAGNEDAPMQMLEQSPLGAHFDWAVFTNMEERYGYQLELQLITGAGAAVPQGSGNNQLLGIYNNTLIPAANVIAYTGAAEGTATAATTMYDDIGLLAAKIGQARKLPPEGWMLTTSRGAWLASSEDQQNRPLMIADTQPDGVWDLMGYPVWVNDAIPRTSGAGQEERIICLRPSDWLILESDRRTSVYTEVMSGTLQARIQMRRYVAALLRQPTSVSYLTGVGMNTGGGF